MNARKAMGAQIRKPVL